MKKRLNHKIFGAVTAIGLALACMPVTSASATEAVGYAQNQEIESRSADTRASIPSGSYRINLNINGRSVLGGRVFNLGGITYVPMFKFADWLGNFSYSNKYGNRVTATVEGVNLEISATEGNLYICANGRYFYTGREVILWGGEIYVPITPLVKALNCYVNWSPEANSFMVRSGDTSRLKYASQVYSEDAVYWLSRIISAEARGESLEGKLAVGNVILNRVRSSQFPNTIYGVIFDKKYGTQFAPTANGTIYNAPTAESVIAAKMCLEGYSLSTDILYFFNPRYTSATWIKQNREYAFTIGNHMFYN